MKNLLIKFILILVLTISLRVILSKNSDFNKKVFACHADKSDGGNEDSAGCNPPSGGGGGAIPPGATEELFIPARPTSSLIDPTASDESLIKILNTKSIEAAPAQSIFSRYATWLKEEIKSITSVLLPNQ